MVNVKQSSEQTAIEAFGWDDLTLKRCSVGETVKIRNDFYRRVEFKAMNPSGLAMDRLKVIGENINLVARARPVTLVERLPGGMQQYSELWFEKLPPVPSV